MNTLFKLNAILLVSFGVASQAKAFFKTAYGLEGTKILCTSMKSPSQAIQLTIDENVIPEDPLFLEQDYHSTVQSLQENILVGEHHQVATKVKSIITRAVSGASYFFDLGESGTISIEDIEYSAYSKTYPVGFYGTISSLNGQIEKLNCQYLP